MRQLLGEVDSVGVLGGCCDYCAPIYDQEVVLSFKQTDGGGFNPKFLSSTCGVELHKDKEAMTTVGSVTLHII